jgi:hypothetical protein
MKRKRGRLWLYIGLPLLAAFLIWGLPIVQTANDFRKAGFFEKTSKTEWDADVRGNLEALHTALRFYMDSEGMLPAGEGWIDAIEPRLRTADLKEGEAEKKIHDPSVGVGKYGFAFNQALSGKHLDDLPAETVVLYQSQQSQRNAVGDPAKDGRASGLGISADGQIRPVIPTADQP